MFHSKAYNIKFMRKDSLSKTFGQELNTSTLYMSLVVFTYSKLTTQL